LLPNAPINSPEYREEWGVRANERGLVVASTTFTEEERAEMLRIRHAYTVFEQFGLLRHVTRYLQWDHNTPVMETIRRVVDVSHSDPERYPLLNWTMRYFDYFNLPPLGWRSFVNELRRFISAEFGLAPTPVLDSVLELQAFLMPDHGRSFPATIALEHDYVRWFRDHTRAHWTGQATSSDAPPLTDYPPAVFTLYGDPLARCSKGSLTSVNDPRNQNMTDDFWLSGHWELDSALIVNQPDVAASKQFIGVREQVPDDLPDETEPRSRVPESVKVVLGSTPGDR
ncbi:MAG TPA: hypothetical protein VD926_09480, partial [Acidimicrobiales bacterium]|nr:hypothetical protein [Acidimicrobiales bacterium]